MLFKARLAVMMWKSQSKITKFIRNSEEKCLFLVDDQQNNFKMTQTQKHLLYTSLLLTFNSQNMQTKYLGAW